ncbi:unnamed protein product [Cylicocyclus nassatus]|uniref:Uncharacterized protein n=1 Tax=Cylicocyclus nassatus TaxID=53992 RepID=A0AA36M925_CYLNA|nr:unnamed protein product [Cylicocyclus nassatus]
MFDYLRDWDVTFSLITFLISFALDALGLYVDDLLLPASELMRNPRYGEQVLERTTGRDQKPSTCSHRPGWIRRSSLAWPSEEPWGMYGLMY